LEKIKKKYTPKLKRLQDRIATAEDKVAREEAQYGQQKMQTAISIGSTLLGAMLGRKMTSVTNVGRATTAMRGAGRAARERGDIARAQEDLRELQRELEKLEREFQDRLADLRTEFENLDPETEELNVAPRKPDISAELVKLVWTPWRVDANGIAERAF
jgi:phage host-nuclease inhibitor protein Gam